MSGGRRFANGLAAALALLAAGPARVLALSDNPYHTIVGRNVFGLRPPVTQQHEAPAAPAPKLTLTGITTILGDRRVLLKIEYPAERFQRPAEEDSCILTEGQRHADIEVLAIDVKARRVKVKVGGAVSELTFETNGVHTPAKPAPTPPPIPVIPSWARLTARTRRMR